VVIRFLRGVAMKKIRLALISLFLVMGLTLGAHATQIDLRILHVNDFHGFAEPHQPAGEKTLRGGIAYLAGAVDRARQQYPSLLLAAGDMTQGNAWANLFQGKSSIAVMNAMKFDAMVVGNHEFDFGPEVLKKRITQANFPILGANVRGLPSLKPYVIKNVQGVKIAIIGVVTQATLASHPRNLGRLTITTPESAIRKYLPELKRRADIILVLSHCGYPADRELAARIPDLDIIVGGHTHTKLLHPEVVGHTIIVQAWEHAKALGILDLRIKDGRIVNFQGSLQEIKPAMGTPDPQVQEIVARYAREAAPILHQTIGETRVDLDASKVRTRETNLGDFIADVMRQDTGADAAMINGGSIKGSIAKGKIEAQDFYNALPYDNYLVVVRLTGVQLKEALEHGVSHGGKPSHRFPQVSGLTFTYSRKAPAGSRVKDVTVAGRPLDPKKTYTVATIDFLAAGGSGFKVFGRAPKSRGIGATADHGAQLRDLVIDAVKARKIIAPQVEDRIKAVD
jgi:5'-nucleotidase/UDP-sugar diphosphatase